MPLGPIIAIFSPASTFRLNLWNSGFSMPGNCLLMLCTDTARRCNFSRSSISKRMYGYWRLEGLTSSSLIFSICRARLVACRALEALAENRLTNDCSSAICVFFLALSASMRSRTWVEAIM